MNQRTRNGHALLLTARQLQWRALTAPFEPERHQQIVRFANSCSHRFALQNQWNRDILCDSQLWYQIELLEDESNIVAAPCGKAVTTKPRKIGAKDRQFTAVSR